MKLFQNSIQFNACDITKHKFIPTSLYYNQKTNDKKWKGKELITLMVTCTNCYIFKYNTFYYRFFAITYDIILLFLFTALTLPGMMRIGVLKISSPSFDLSLRGAGIRSSSTLWAERIPQSQMQLYQYR